MRKIKFLLIVFLIPLVSCSKDSEEEGDDNNQNLVDCTMEEADLGCALVFLDGKDDWVRVAKQGDLADPFFLYPKGEREDPYGTITIFLENGKPLIRLNDLVLNDYLVKVAQSADGSDATCKVGNNVETPDTDGEDPVDITVNKNLEFPFYIQLQANVCF